MNVQCSGGSRSFLQSGGSRQELGDEECSGRPLEVDSNQLRAIFEVDPLTTTQEVAEQLNVDHSMVLWHLKQIGKVKKLHEWVSHELTANQKKSLFLSVIFSYFTQQGTISQLDCDVGQKVDCIQQLAVTHFPKPNLHPKKFLVTVWWAPAHMIHYSFLNLGKIITSEKFTRHID